ncbi:translation initiation factor [Babesia ovata]|uniref:Translation initiation factor n=1 Tax=Babesia ovata TaxID=189622 RepID=A0A2H6KDM1_9APIC|nr:translation initiation factor [Babesia ovata]GBE61087.1 translation initiation factor [Babesia ovata]
MAELATAAPGEAPEGDGIYPHLTFNKRFEDYHRLSSLFETCKLDVTAPLPLKNKWVIWEQIVKNHDQRHNADYKCHTRPLVSFDSPSELSTSQRLFRECTDGSQHVVDAIMIFRDGIEPMWEDVMNKDGGHFDYRFKPGEVGQFIVDEFWNNIILGLIGGDMPHAHLINGVRLVDKLATRFPVVRIEVWFQNLGEDNDATQLMKSIGTCMARRLRLAARRHGLRRPRDVGLRSINEPTVCYRYDFDKEGSELRASWSNQTAHKKSIRKAAFSNNGRDIIAVAADKRVSLLDVEGSTVKWYGRGHRAAISTFCTVDNNTIATGDDDGEIRIWDTRLAKAACRSNVSEFEDSINGMLLGKDSKELLAVCDDQLGCFNLKSGRVSLQGMSDNVEDELQCMTYAKGMRKVVCGSNTGHICMFTYGRWGDLDDRMTLHANSVESVVAFDDDTMLVGGDDGKVHVISIHPNSVLGAIDTIHKLGLSISSTDSLCINGNKSHLDTQRIVCRHSATAAW